MVNINAQEWLDKKYPINGVCKRDNDLENKGKTREQITKLDISKGKVGGSIFNSEEIKNLIGSLKLEGFTNLRTLIISSHQLLSLDVSNCLNLEELDCHDNELISLNVIGCYNLKKINCSSNPSLNEVDLKNCKKLTKQSTITDLTYDNRTSKLVRNSKPEQSGSRKVKKGKNDNRIEQELSKKRNELKNLQNKLVPKLGDNVGKTLTEYFFKSHKWSIEGTDSDNRYNENLTNLRKKLGSDPQGNKLLDQIIKKQQEIIELEKNLESTSSQIQSPPPYYHN